jgi:hypothetical protein
LCPVCDGGASRETTFNIFEIDQFFLGYKCHRSSCGVQGVVTLLGEPVKKKSRRPVPFVNKHPLTDEQKDKVLKLFNLTSRTLDTFGVESYTDNDGNERLWIPINDYEGRFAGFVGRLLVKRDGFKKAITYKNDNASALSYYVPPTRRVLGSEVVVVEDAPSAMRIASAGIVAAALLSGDYTQAQAQELRDLGCRCVLSLDPDAKDKAIRQAIAHGKTVTTRVVIGKHDVKNMDDDEFNWFINCII